MATKTLHVYRSDGAWAVKKQGSRAEIFPTQRQAIEAARQTVRSGVGQVVIHGKDGRIRDHETYGLIPIQDPPRKSRLANRIKRAVGRVALERVLADNNPPSAGTRKK
jgi:hypothetical protein